MPQNARRYLAINFCIMKKLTREEMKALTGGVAQQCDCQCFDMPGTWSGTYQNEQEQFDDISTYCRYGGYCACS